MCLCALSRLPALAAPVANLAPNASFEQGAGDQPNDWSFYSWQGAEGWWDATVFRTGKHSLGLRGLNGGWSTNFPVEAGQLCRVRLHYRAEDGPSQLVLYVRAVRGPRDLLNLVYKPVPTLPPDRKGAFVDGVFVGGADEQGWVLFDGGEFAVPDGVSEMNLLIKIRGQGPGAKLWLDDIRVMPIDRPVVPATAALLAEVAGAKVWTEDVNRKILPDQQPPQGAPLARLELSAARGEYESFQIAVTPTEEWKSLNWSWGSFAGPGELDKSCLRCRAVECVDIRQTRGPHSHKGLNPDPLTDRLLVEAPASRTQCFWFTLRVPQKTAPGNYRTELALSVGRRRACAVPVKLHVRSFALPRRPSLDVRSAFRSDLALKRESGDDEKVLRRYYRDFYEHRSRCSPGVLVWPRLSGDEVTVDLDRYVEHLKFMRDELGATRFNTPSLWIGHGGEHKMPREARWRGRRVFADDELTELNAEFEKPFRSFMTQLLDRLKAEGLFLDCTVRFFDEPNLSDQPTVNGLRTLSVLLLDIEPKLTVAMTATYPHPDLIDVAKLWVLHTDAWYPNLDKIAAARKAGCRISVYNNAVNFPEHRRLRTRLWPWLLRKYAVDGTYSWWGTVCWRGEVEDPWTCGQGSSGVLLYPPRSPDEKGPIDSIRWELLREGLEDYEYLLLAEQLAEKLEAAGKNAVAKRGRDAVAAALDLVEKWPNVRAANDEPYTLDVTKVAEARERLAEAIEGMEAR